jgi:hypothetical protein
MSQIKTVIVVLVVALFPTHAFSDIELPFSTTFDCDDCTSFDPLTCQGIEWGGNWSASGNWSTITSDANNPNGDGHKGLRGYIGDGINSNSGGIDIVFPSTQSEIWVRWYYRYELGFEWSYLTYHKWLYFDIGHARNVVPEPYGFDGFRFGFNDGTHEVCSGCGWNTIMVNGEDGTSGKKSDGLWHCVEIHIKMESSEYANDGEVDLWYEGELIMSRSDVDTGGTSNGGWDEFRIPENQRTPDNGKVMEFDIDDIAISNSGYIGPLTTTPSQSGVTMSGVTIGQ